MTRRIEETDIPEIIHQLLHLRDESPTYAEVIPDIDYVSGSLRTLIQSDAFIGVIEDGIGCMFGMLTRQWYSYELNAHELILYVLPEHRGARTAMRLIAGLEDAAKRGGARYLQVGVTTGMQEDRTIKLYERLGYEKFGGGLRKELQYV